VRLLLDVCVSSRVLVNALSELGYDVVLVRDINSTASDADVLQLAAHDERILITADKDFGELMFLHKRDHGPIVRLVALSVHDHADALGLLFRDYQQELTGRVIVTLSKGHIRIRHQPHGQ
jgi:predicted nuclease of predicted toxin-antitoxin system